MEDMKLNYSFKFKKYFNAWIEDNGVNVEEFQPHEANNLKILSKMKYLS